MKVFMVGWEFPPFISGGLGTACYGLTRAMDELGIDVIFAMPKATGPAGSNAKMLAAVGESGSYGQMGSYEFKHVKFKITESALQAYGGAETFKRRLEELSEEKLCGCRTECGGFDVNEDALRYGQNIYSEVNRYARIIARLAGREDFDVVHAHDWMTYPAGVAAARVSGKPLVVQVHSTEFDRSGENINQMVYDIERYGMHKAKKVIAVSNYTRNILIDRYAVPPEKIEVVYNGVIQGLRSKAESTQIQAGDKVVLFLGRITMQKGPEYFIAAARKVIDILDNVKFIMAGSGDMMRRMVDMAASAGIGHKVLFTGFLSGDQLRKAYSMADLYVMPSVSEPFGIAPLEAINHDVPALISKQSGVSEVLRHALKVDFWDIDEMTNKIVAVLRYPPLESTLRKESQREVTRLNWQDSARNCERVYNQVLSA